MRWLLGRKYGFTKREFIILLFIILLPNLLRQILYYVTFLKTNSIDFIVSFETVILYKSFPFLGFLEEIIIGFVFVFLWFYFSNLRFFAYGWITDALFDYVSVIVWFFIGKTPLQLLNLSVMMRFILREVVLFYFIIAPILVYYKFDIKRLSYFYSFIGLVFLVVILIF